MSFNDYLNKRLNEGVEEFENIDPAVINKAFDKRGLSSDEKENQANSIEYDDRGLEVVVSFTSKAYGGEFPENNKEVLDAITKEIGANEWFYRGDNPWVVTFSFED